MLSPGPPGSPQACTGFLPSRDAFAFTNHWPPGPAVTLRTPVRSISIGNAAAGLCGGMVFAALDYWHAGLTPPGTRPDPGSALFRYLVRRLIWSWHIPAGVARYYGWMNLPDGDSRLDLLGRHVLTERGISFRTVTEQWPRVQASLDRGIPAALGLVTVASTNPAQLRHNHQGLAFGYTMSGSEVTLHLYDPNTGQDDSVAISFDVSSPEEGTTFGHNLKLDWPVRGFFMQGYSPALPPASPGSRPADLVLPAPYQLPAPERTTSVPERIAKGDLVEDFELPDETGTPRKLSEFLAKGPVVLFFYPAAMTRGCTAESCHFRDLAGEFAAAGAQRVGISRDSVGKQRQFADKHSFGYPLLSDPDGKVASKLGVRRGLALGPLATRRMTFVIGQDGRVLDVIHSETSMESHADRALEVLKAAQAPAS